MTPSQQFETWWPTQSQGWGTHKETERRAWLAAYAAGREAGLEEAEEIVAAWMPNNALATGIGEAVCLTIDGIVLVIHQARSQP